MYKFEMCSAVVNRYHVLYLADHPCGCMSSVVTLPVEGTCYVDHCCRPCGCTFVPR